MPLSKKSKCTVVRSRKSAQSGQKRKEREELLNRDTTEKTPNSTVDVERNGEATAQSSGGPLQDGGSSGIAEVSKNNMTEGSHMADEEEAIEMGDALSRAASNNGGDSAEEVLRLTSNMSHEQRQTLLNQLMKEMGGEAGTYSVPARTVEVVSGRQCSLSDLSDGLAVAGVSAVNVGQQSMSSSGTMVSIERC
jgi:hypothetical protein